MKLEPLKVKYEECEKGEWCKIVKGGHIVCVRIINGKQYVSTDGLLLKEREDLSKLNWLR